MSVWETLFGRSGQGDIPGQASAPGRFLNVLSNLGSGSEQLGQQDIGQFGSTGVSGPPSGANGSVAGRIGTAAGGLSGSLMDLWSSIKGVSGKDGQPGQASIFRDPLMGRRGEVVQPTTKTSEQEDIMSQFLKMASGMLDPSANEAYARSQYEQQGIPSIMQRFRGVGGQNQASSGVLSAIQGGRADLEAQLGAQRFGQGRDLAQLGLGQRLENVYAPGDKGFIKPVLPAIASAATSAAMGGGATAIPQAILELLKLAKGEGVKDANSTT